jgi:hypothetical protein
MRIVFKVYFLLFFIFLSDFAFADAFVCVDKQGKKSFSSEACVKNGLQPATQDFAVDGSKAISAIVISPGGDQESTGAQGMKTKKYKKGLFAVDSETFLESPIHYFLIVMLLGIVVLFFLLFFRFHKRHHRKLELRGD